jgi:predicted RNase H-like HicB family nuclease
MRKYLIVIEQAKGNLSAYIPDIPGCVTVGDSVDEILANMREALQGHLELMAEDGEEIPEPTSIGAGYVEVEVPEPAARKSA